MTGRDSVISTYNSGAGSFSGGLPSFPPHQTAAAAAAHRRFSEAVTYGYGHGHGHSHVYGYPNGDGYGHTHVNGHGNNHAVHGGYSALNNGNGNGHGNDKGTGSGSGQGYMGTGTGSRVISSESTASAPSLPSTITTGAANGIAEQRQQPAPVLPADHPVYRPDSVSGLAGAHPNPSSSAPAYGQHHQHPAAIHPPTGYGHGSYASGGYTQHLKKEYDEYERDDGHGPMNSHAHVQSAQGYPSSATGYYRDKEKGNNSRKREREWEDDCDRDRARDSTDPVGLLNVLNHHLPVAPHHHPHHSHGLLSAQLYHHSAYDHDRTLPPLHSSSCNPAHHPSAHHHPDHHFHIHTPASSQCQSTCASRANSAAVPLPNASIATSAAFDLPPTILQESFIETYFEYAYTWCPVLDRAMLLIEPHILESPLLKQALALLGSRIEPPVMQHASPNQYYERATQLFHNNIEKDPIVSLQALMMLYWWGAAPAPGTVSFDTVWWWTGIAIRLAQQVGLHRELPPSAQTPRSCPPGLRRRIWWTLYARERLTSMCEGRPCIIDPADCDVKEPSVHDFPETVDLLKAQTFVSWVKLSRIVGRVAKYRSSKTEDTRFPGHIARELIDWVKSLPDSLWLPIGGDRSCTSTNPSSATTPGCNAVAGKGAGALSFHRDVHQLYLPYLSAITLLYLTKSSQPLAKAYQTAILSAACVARIFEDFLARRSVRFLQGLSGWHIAIAILALLHGRKIKQLTEECDRNIALLRIALKEVGKSWSSARLFDAGFERVIRSEMFASTVAPMTPPLQQQPQQHPVLSTLVAPQQSIPPPHVAAQVSPTSVTPTVAADSSEVDIDQLDKQTKDDENKDKQEDERRSSDTDAKSVSSFAEKCASPKESSDSLPNPSASPKDDVSSVISDSKVQSTAASTPAITTTASATTTMTVPTTTSTAIHTPVTSNQITLPPMALHPHLRPARPGCNSSLSELADVATGTLINWLDFFPFATRETSPLVDVLLQTSRAGLLEFDAVDWPVGDMSRMLNDLLYY
ncbi:hypothetical protein KEM54_000629 [Ascosphaera aggregata]|nr:hypothetical protein KEM54_000629 [Ascosphaera aggregata]